MRTSIVLTALLALSVAAATLPLGGTAALPGTPPSLEAPGSDAAWARALVAALPRATSVNDGDGNKLFDDLDRALLAAPALRVSVIVSFVQGVSTEAGLAAVQRAAPDVPVARAFRIIPAYAGSLTLTEALSVAQLAEVRQIELDRPGTPELETSTLVMGADAVVDEMNVTGDLDGNPAVFTAQDVAIAVLDTGFHAEHADLAEGKILHFLDLGDGKTEAYDPGGHGTHVASIAAGLGRANPEYRGVAPGAAIVGIKIEGANGDAESLAIAGYEWIVENKDAYGVRVATMSFGFGIATDGTTALERAVDAAWDAGIVTFKSNGNSGPGRSTMTIPSAARGILGIGSMLDPGKPVAEGPAPTGAPYGFMLSSYSSRGPTTDGRVKPDLTAPGQAIMAAQSGTKDGYVSLSGTSMASPFAAGVAALMIAANPALTPDEVRDLLRDTAEDWGVAGADIDYGWGRIQAREAVRAAVALAGREALNSTAPAVPFHEVRAGIVPQGPYEGTVEIADTSNPIAATFIAEGQILAAQILDPSGTPVGHLSTPGPSRQHAVAFTPSAPGTYTFRVVAPPGTAFVVDFSHGLAPPPLLDLPVGPLESTEAAPEQATVPGPAFLLLAGAVVAAGALTGSRRRQL